MSERIDDALGEASQIAELLESIEQLRRALYTSAEKNTADMRLMRLFGDRVPRTLRQVSEQLKIDQSTANRQVNTAVHRGLLIRERETAGLPYLFTPTDEGLDQYGRFVDLCARRYRAGIEALGVNRDQFATLMHTFVAAIDA